MSLNFHFEIFSICWTEDIKMKMKSSLCITIKPWKYIGDWSASCASCWFCVFIVLTFEEGAVQNMRQHMKRLGKLFYRIQVAPRRKGKSSILLYVDFRCYGKRRLHRKMKDKIVGRKFRLLQNEECNAVTYDEWIMLQAVKGSQTSKYCPI